MASYFDISQSAVVSIDSILDEVNEARRSAGLQGGPELAVFDKDSGKKFRRFQKRSDEEEASYREAINERRGAEIRKGQRRTGQTGLVSIRGWQAYDKLMNDTGDDYDNAPTYICEYCSKIGRNRRYNAIICDNCSECVNCEQFLRKECSGCEYSRWREGVPYGQLNKEAVSISTNDSLIINDVMTSLKTSRNETDADGFKPISMSGWGVDDV